MFDESGARQQGKQKGSSSVETPGARSGNMDNKGRSGIGYYLGPRYSRAIELTFIHVPCAPDDATEVVTKHSSRLQASIDLPAPVTAFRPTFSCSVLPPRDMPKLMPLKLWPLFMWHSPQMMPLKLWPKIAFYVATINQLLCPRYGLYVQRHWYPM